MEQRIKELEQRVAKASGLLDANYIILERIDKHVRDIPHIKENIIALDKTINSNGLVASVKDNATQISTLAEYISKEQETAAEEKKAKMEIKRDFWKYFIRGGMTLFFVFLASMLTSVLYAWSVLDDSKLGEIQKMIGVILKWSIYSRYSTAILSSNY